MGYNTSNLTDCQVKDICESYTNYVSVAKICNKYGFKYPKLYFILKENGIELHGAKKISSEIVDKLITLVDNKTKPITIASACKTLGIGKSTGAKYLRERGYKFEDPSAVNRKYTINNDYFKDINSPDKAQILGLIMADGTLSSYNKSISIRLKYDDEEYLKKINEKIGSNKPLYYVNATKMVSPLNNKQYTSSKIAVLDITNKFIYNDLINMGIKPRKTYLNLGIPHTIPNKYKKSFLLGFFEGDGCITWTIKGNLSSFNLNFAVSPKMAKDIFNLIKKELNVKGHIKKHHQSDVIYVLQYQKIKDIIKILKWIYSDSAFYMKRKYDKKEKLFNILSNRGYNVI